VACVQVVVESDRVAVQYGSILLDEGEPIKRDMALDATDEYLYAMTDSKVNNRQYYFVLSCSFTGYSSVIMKLAIIDIITIINMENNFVSFRSC